MQPDMRNKYNILVTKLKGNGPLGRPKRGRRNNIKINLKEIGSNVHWIQLAREMFQWVATCEHGDGLLGLLKFREVLDLATVKFLKDSTPRSYLSTFWGGDAFMGSTDCGPNP
jgi:hypothetical protein